MTRDEAREELLATEVAWVPQQDGVAVITVGDLITEKGFALVEVERQIETISPYVMQPQQSRQTMTKDEAVAEAWASIDGKLYEFLAGKGASSYEDKPGGYRSGYIEDAKELIRRIEKRGFVLVRVREQKRNPITIEADHD